MAWQGAMARTPTSATGAAERGRPGGGASGGFTLIEVLVVLVIFGIAAGLIALRLLPDDAERARREAEATAALLERAADEAERTGRPLAWHPDGERAFFESPDEAGKWTVLADDPDFGPRTLPAGLRWGALRFRVPAGTPSAQAAPAPPGASDAGNLLVRVPFLPGQTVPPFDVALQAAEAGAWLHGDALGRVRVEAGP